MIKISNYNYETCMWTCPDSRLLIFYNWSRNMLLSPYVIGPPPVGFDVAHLEKQSAFLNTENMHVWIQTSETCVTEI